MKIFKNFQTVLYFLTCVLVVSFLYGCKEKELNVSAFDGLPESTFVTQVKSSLESHTPLVIAFTAEWCPHCRKYKPTLSEVKDLYNDKVTFINIDVDDKNGSPISERFQVRGIPTTAFVRADGSVYKVQVGEIAKDELSKIAEELIANKKRKKGEPVAPFPIDLNKKEEPTSADQQVKEKELPAVEVEPAPAEQAVPGEQPAVPEEGEFQEDIPMPSPADLENIMIEEPPLPPAIDNSGDAMPALPSGPSGGNEQGITPGQSDSDAIQEEPSSEE